MSARKDKRARPFKRLLSDPWRKLASVLLALLLWYYLDSLVTTPLNSQLDVTFNSPPTNGDWIDVTLPGKNYRMVGIVDGETFDPIEDVGLGLQGPNDRIAQVESRMNWRVQMTENNVLFNLAGEPFIAFQREDLHHADGGGDLVPSSICVV